MSDAFAELMAEVMTTADRFGHRQHVELTWRAVRRYGTTRAIDVVSDGIRTTARYAGAPQKYNATVSRAWVELVAHHVEHHRERHGEDQAVDGPEPFLAANAELLDKRLLARFYRPSTLASDAARVGWVEPDREPFPWEPPVTPKRP